MNVVYSPLFVLVFDLASGLPYFDLAATNFSHVTVAHRCSRLGGADPSLSILVSGLLAGTVHGTSRRSSVEVEYGISCNEQSLGSGAGDNGFAEHRQDTSIMITTIPQLTLYIRK